MKYFYAPIFNEADGRVVPGKDDGTGVIVSASGNLLGVSSPKCDIGLEQRFVLEASDDFQILLGWMERTKQEINLDYPGLIP